MNSGSGSSTTPDTYTKTRTMLNGAKTLEPLLLGILRYPGMAKDPARLDAATDTIIELHQSVTRQVESAIAPDANNPALRASIAEPLAHLVGQTWSAENESVDPRALAGAFLKTVQFSEPTPDTVFTDLPRATDQALERAKAVSRCIPVFMKLESMNPAGQKLFMGQQEGFAQRMKLFRDEINSRASAISSGICPPGASEKQHNITYKSVLNRVAGITADLLDIEYRRLGREFKHARQTGKSKDKAYVKNLIESPKGILTANVFSQVDMALSDLFPSHAAGARPNRANSPSPS
jgi:hypothetical protein